MVPFAPPTQANLPANIQHFLRNPHVTYWRRNRQWTADPVTYYPPSSFGNPDWTVDRAHPGWTNERNREALQKKAVTEDNVEVITELAQQLRELGKGPEWLLTHFKAIIGMADDWTVLLPFKRILDAWERLLPKWQSNPDSSTFVRHLDSEFGSILVKHVLLDFSEELLEDALTRVHFDRWMQKTFPTALLLWRYFFDEMGINRLKSVNSSLEVWKSIWADITPAMNGGMRRRMAIRDEIRTKEATGALRGRLPEADAYSPASVTLWDAQAALESYDTCFDPTGRTKTVTVLKFAFRRVYRRAASLVFFCYHTGGIWSLKADLYKRYDSTVLVLIHAINADRKTFSKPAGSNAPSLSRYGPNLLTSDGETWRRHRRIAVSSFSERNAKKIWDEAVKAVETWHEMISGRERAGKAVVEGVEDDMASLTLIVFGEAAFGRSFPWPSSAEPDAARDSLLAVVLPSWAFQYLPSRKLRLLREAFTRFEAELRGIVWDRKEEMSSGGAAEKKDLLSELVRANLLEEGMNKLTDQELLSNAYIFLSAGHEMSATSLSTLFLLLALYPSHQDPIVVEVNDYLASSRPFTYPEAFSGLPVALATISEGLRLAGPVNTVVKRAEKDTVLTGKNNEGGERSVFVPAGAVMKENIRGAHYNALSWPDPFDFRPSRFLDAAGENGDRTSFAPFSSGLRGCIGKQFALAEMIVVVALTVHRYRIEVPASKAAEWSLQDGEGQRERRERIFKATWPFTMGPSGIDLAFEPRAGKVDNA
ncbi:hypothetical protein JCM11641_008214 [Rhodosporidiobolus odoratus]